MSIEQGDQIPEGEKDTDWGEPTETHDLNLAEEGEGQTEKSADSELIKVDGTVSVTWRGTSGCCDQDRVNREWSAGVARWVEQQKAAHPTLTFVSRGWGAASGECRKWEDWPNGRRCNGSLSGPVYAYFRS
ncbi:hypothetical protein [Sphingomonas sp.]|jgi:hypothetical protein|uniref:hypothetical protein n=1 Tax=Sphingomonas sp. TaxID=28214 RepID=UPI002E165664|nr:hypothetical protein [Sphingomonas sp.]